MKKSLAILEFDLLKEMVSRFAGSGIGAERIRQLEPYTDGAALRLELEKMAEAKEYIEAQGAVDFSPLQDPQAILAKLRILDLALEPGEILALLRVIELSQRVRNALHGLYNEYPRLSKLAHEIPNLKALSSKIEGKILPSGELSDGASAELRRIRISVKTTQSRIQRLLEHYLVRKESDKVLQDDFVTIRSGRFVVPVKVEQKRALSGVVHGASSSGATLFVEPMEVIEPNNDLIRLQEQEAQEVARLLALFTDYLRAEVEPLRILVDRLAEFDVLLAKAKFGRQFRCVIPVVNQEGRLHLQDARHPLLEETLTAQGRPIVPISIDLTPVQPVLIISGPNTGGKTVALKTIGLLTLMAHVGLPTPAVDAVFPQLRQVLADIGDHQSIKESLSTFSSHIINIAEMVENLRLPGLVLLDEVGTGTDPDQGAALAIAIIDFFRKQGALVVATTHHNSVKAHAFATPGVASAAAEFDEASLQPTYRLIGGLAGRSSGLQIAQRLGLRVSIIDAAFRLVDTKELAADQYLDRIRHKMADIDQQAAALAEQRAQLEEAARRRARAQEEKEKEAARLLAAKVDALTVDFQQKAEALLKTIHDKSIRLELKQEVQRKALLLREQQRRQATSSPTAVSPAAAEFQAGDRVRIGKLSLQGTVVRVDGRKAEINAHGKLIKAAVDDLEGCESAAPVAQGISLPHGIYLELADDQETSTELNVIGCTVDEALARADRFLDHASVTGLSVVRLIHGHGTGKLKKAIAIFLQAHPLVIGFDQTENRGGVTVAKLRN
ncbi:MAG: Smr/MutS family protein [Acidobacteria bacterium]|nr:Smr/MutS family protein [Acidobacteriota bacterium]MBI3656828.1 Smr/MutS family protein [Acidobacteriota bacterium]